MRAGNTRLVNITVLLRTNLVGVLTGSWHPHSPLTVGVHVSELVTNRRIRSIDNQANPPDPLHSVHGKTQIVLDYDVVGGADRPLTDVLGDEEEVVPVPLGDGVVQHGAGRRVVQLLAEPKDQK